MTKSEAKAIQQRMGRAARVLNGTCEPDAIQWAALSHEQREMVNNAITAAREDRTRQASPAVQRERGR